MLGGKEDDDAMAGRTNVAAKAERASPPTAADLQRILRDAGLRATGARIAVLRFLLQSAVPSSHAELIDALGGEGYDRVTLYRNLTDLAEAGLVTRTDLGDHVWRFELKRASSAGHPGEHPHFVCTECGEVSCLPEASVKVVGGKVPRAAMAKNVTVQIRGICDTCE
jgi:Fur family ferric uptake transcriptional regulator